MRDARSSSGSTVILENEDEEVTIPCRARRRKRSLDSDGDAEDCSGLSEPKVIHFTGCGNKTHFCRTMGDVVQAKICFCNTMGIEFLFSAVLLVLGVCG